MARYPVKLPDAVWLATATLHRDSKSDATFSTREIRDEVISQEVQSSKHDRSITDSITSDCVARLEAKKRRTHCKLHQKKRGDKYRLWRPGDPCHSSREGSPVEPDKQFLPPEFQHYIDWYRDDYCGEKMPMPLSARDASARVGAQIGRMEANSSDNIGVGDRNGRVGQGSVGMVDLLKIKSGPPPWTNEVVTRAVRDTSKVHSLKNLYQDKCQVCGYTIQVTADRRYSEAHHLRPLGSGGDDDYDNMLVLCPTHHVEFDCAVLGVSADGRRAVDKNGKERALAVLSGHSLAPKNIEFHLSRMALSRV